MGVVRTDGESQHVGAAEVARLLRESRDTMLFNNDSRVEQDPDRGPRLAMEHVLRLS